MWESKLATKEGGSPPISILSANQTEKMGADAIGHIGHHGVKIVMKEVNSTRKTMRPDSCSFQDSSALFVSLLDIM